MFVLYLLILILEVLYYSLFMKFNKNGNFIKYIVLFILVTILFAFVDTNKFYSYLILLMTILFGLKYIVKVETSLYDMLIITIMLLVKLIIEIFVIGILFMLIKNAYILSLIAGFVKILVLLPLKNKISHNYKSLKIIWDNNNFGVRYLFTLALFLYTIISFLFLIF